MTLEEAFFHQITKCLPFHLSKRQQGYIIGAFRAALDKSPARVHLFNEGDRVIVVDPGEGNDVEVGDTGTILSFDKTQEDTLVQVRWDREHPCCPGYHEWGIFLKRLQLVR